MAIAGLLVGAIGGAVFGWHYAGDTGDTVGRFAHAFVYGLVGTVLTSTFLASMTALQALVAIVRVSRLIGLPLLGFLTFVAWHSIIWLNRAGGFEYLGQAHVIVVMVVSGFGMLVVALITSILAVIGGALVFARRYNAQ